MGKTLRYETPSFSFHLAFALPRSSGPIVDVHINMHLPDG